MRRKEEKEGEEKGKEVGRKGGRERKKWGERGSEEKEGVGGRTKHMVGWILVILNFSPCIYFVCDGNTAP